MTEPWVVFTLNSQRYCTDATHIKEVITYRPANPIPGAPIGVAGIIRVRSDKITLFSGARLVTKRDSPPKKDGYIILIENENGLFGITIDGVEGIIGLNPDHIDPSSVTDDNAVLGTIPYQGKLLTAVDLVTYCENAIAAQ